MSDCPLVRLINNRKILKTFEQTGNLLRDWGAILSVQQDAHRAGSDDGANSERTIRAMKAEGFDWRGVGEMAGRGARPSDFGSGTSEIDASRSRLFHLRFPELRTTSQWLS
jgi:hypothetical protein